MRAPSGDHDGAAKKPGARNSGGRTRDERCGLPPSAPAIISELAPSWSGSMRKYAKREPSGDSVIALSMPAQQRARRAAEQRYWYSVPSVSAGTLVAVIDRLSVLREGDAPEADRRGGDELDRPRALHLPQPEALLPAERLDVGEILPVRRKDRIDDSARCWSCDRCGAPPRAAPPRVRPSTQQRDRDRDTGDDDGRRIAAMSIAARWRPGACRGVIGGDRPGLELRGARRADRSPLSRSD